jgi:hypothetical protein
MARKMNRLDKQIMMALLGSQQSMYGLEQYLKENGLIESNYATVYRHIKKMQKNGLLGVTKVTRKNGKQDNRGTEKPELTPKGIATLIIDGDLQEKELIRAMERQIKKNYSDLPSSFLPETQVDKIFVNTLSKMKYKINLRFFDEDYFNRMFNVSFAESLLEQMRKNDFQKETDLKAKIPALRKKYVDPERVEMLRALRKQFTVERDNFSHYVNILNQFLEKLTEK